MPKPVPSDVKLAELTAEENAEFTPINRLAFDVAMRNAAKKGETIPCWLCTSEEAKAEYRKNAVAAFNEQTGKDYTEPFLAIMIGNQLDGAIAEWKNAERAYKQYRAEGNPRAFFAS